MESFEATLALLFYLLTGVIWIWALIDLVKQKALKAGMSILFLILILFFPIIGSILYFQLKRNKSFAHKTTFNPQFNTLKVR
jgi:predicted membrane channel-forming protein YqfA (hemolysin III family)